MHNAMVTLEQNDNNTALISAPKLQKVRRNKQWMPVLSEHRLFRDDDDKKSLTSFLHLLISSFPIVWLNVCLTYLWVCVFIAVNNEKVKGRLSKRLNKPRLYPPSSHLSCQILTFALWNVHLYKSFNFGTQCENRLCFSALGPHTCTRVLLSLMLASGC